MPTLFRILLVDDNVDLLAILQRAAEISFPKSSILQVYSASAARTYFSQLEGRGPSLVLLDLDLGESVTGVDLLRELRGHASTHLLPVVILTISKQKTDVQMSYGTGASSYTLKPETFEAWKGYLTQLRVYWQETVTLPLIYYKRQEW